MPRGVSRKLSKPLIGEDGRIYGCSGNNFFAFENNGTIAWSLHLDYQCNLSMAPVHGGYGKIYLVAENRILMINFGSTQTSEPVAEIFFGPEHGENREIVIIGVSVSTLSSTVFINMKNRGLFAYRYNGSLRWSVGPVLYHYSYRQGCKKNLTDCYFASVPMLDQCEASIYIDMEGKVSHSISDYTIVSAIRPKAALFTMLVPATGSMYWFESYTGQFLTSLSKSDLSKFVVDEEIIVAFLVASMVLAALVRFCFTFWTKKKLQAQGIGSFLDKRRSLRHRKKAFDRTITELEQKASKEEVGNEVFEKLGDIVRERECIERKLSSMYSLGRDKTHSQSKSLLPLHKGKTKAKRYSFKDANESVAIFHTVSDTCSSESSIEEEIRMVEGMDLSTKAKGKKPMVEDSSSSDI
ncbi:hypothetical protein TanjilG_11957 [Lupinus angustifolius]|uniref:Uncharacterized protein n=1 Tax=Lupinus angustifolius TaxID=3871 RepID=A0A1J7I3D5_LUPAN|nr:hypothetical protein TanjilG_11957 [Lupinus angustifolius]